MAGQGRSSGAPAEPSLAQARITLEPAPRVLFGRGTVGRVGPVALAAAGASSVLVVTDARLVNSPVVSAVVEALGEVGVASAVYDGAVPNPRAVTVDTGADRATSMKAGAVVAVGGGSAIDTGKGVALGATNRQRGRRLADPDALEASSLPVIAVPTTSGVAAELTSFGLFTDVVKGRRYRVGHPTALPFTVVLDPELTVSLKPALTAAGAAAALSHAVEALLSNRANPFSDGLALQAVTTVSQFVERAMADGTDLEARSQLQLAAHTAGHARKIAGHGLVDAVAHIVGARFDVGYGPAVSALLPEVAALALPVRTSRLARLGFALGVARTDRDDSGNAEAAVTEIAGFCERLGLRPPLSSLGVGPDDLGRLVTDALADPVTADAPVLPSEDELTDLLRQRLGTPSARQAHRR